MRALSKTGWAGLAMALLGACAAMGPRAAPPSDLEQARAATRSGEWATAAQRWGELFVHGGEDHAEACRETGRALLELGDARGACQVLEAGLVRYGEDVELLELHGNALARLGFRRAAESAYLEALRLQPDHASTLLELGRVRLELELDAAALSALKRRITLGADDAETFWLAAQAWRGCGRFVQAFDAYERALAVAGGEDRVPVARLVTAAGLYEHGAARGRVVGASDRSRAWLQRAVSRDPQNTEAHRLLGVVLEGLGDPAAARAELVRAVETDPACLRSLAELARFQERYGEHEAAVETARSALEQAEEIDPDLRRELERIVRALEEEPLAAER